MIDTPDTAGMETGMETLDAGTAGGSGAAVEPEAARAAEPTVDGADAEEAARIAADAKAVDLGFTGRSESGVGDIAFIVVFMLAVLFTMKLLGRRGGKRVPGADASLAQKATQLRAMYAASEDGRGAADGQVASIEGKPAGGAVRVAGAITEEVASLRERVATLERLVRRGEARMADLERQHSRAMLTSAVRDAAEREGGPGAAGSAAEPVAAVETKPLATLSPPPPLGAVRGEILRLAKTGVSEIDIAVRVGVPESHVRLVTGMSRSAA